jgi:oxalate decarboxylase/phosphoglucose isomerase-like protein (cupin superfamily)
MQKQYFENGVWVPNRVEKIYFVTASPGDEIVISKEFGHSWSNIGDTPLVSFDDWRSGHQPSDYEPMKNLRGLAYYLVADGGKVKTVKNENYNSLPDPIWITAQEFKEVNKI